MLTVASSVTVATVELAAAEETAAAAISALRLMVPIAENTSSPVFALKPHNCSSDCIPAKLVFTFDFKFPLVSLLKSLMQL